MEHIQIVWNGCDSYELSNNLVFTRKEEFKPFNVIEIDENLIQFDNDGEMILDNIFCVAGGKGYRFFKAI
jgi:hypothetical protein